MRVCEQRQLIEVAGSLYTVTHAAGIFSMAGIKTVQLGRNKLVFSAIVKVCKVIIVSMDKVKGEVTAPAFLHDLSAVD